MSSDPKISKRWWFAAYVLFVCLSLAAFWPTLWLPYAFDDLDVLTYISFYRSHALGLTDTLFLTHNEHSIPLLRLLFMAATNLQGLDAVGLRIFLVVIHAAGALVTAGLVWRCTGSRTATLFAGCAYAISSAFAGSPIWYPAASLFLFPSVILHACLLILAGNSGNGLKRILVAYAGFVLACGVDGFAAIPGLILALAILFWGPSSRIRKGIIAFGFVLTTLAVILFVQWIYQHYAHRPFPSPAPTLRGFGVIVWLALSPLGRLPWTLMPGLPLTFGVIASLTLGMGTVFVATWRWLAPATRRFLLASWSGHLLFIAVVGMARASADGHEILHADRYAYYALAPVVFHLAAVYAAAMNRWPSYLKQLRWAGAGWLLLGVVANPLNLRETVPWGFYAPHRAALSEARTLARLTAEEGRRRPLSLLDCKVPFDGIHKEALRYSTIFFGEFPKGTPDVRFHKNLEDKDRRRQNELFDSWGREIGRPPRTQL